MKPEEILILILEAGPSFVGEHRGTLAELVEWVDKSDGKAKSFVKISHLFEFGIGSRVQSITLNETAGKSVTDPKQVKPLFERGKRYLVQLREMGCEHGIWSGRLNSSFSPIEIEA